MSKQWRIAPILAMAMALVMLISACGGSADSTSSSSTPGTTAKTAGTPGSYNCVQGTIATNGSTALGPLVKKVASDYQNKCSGANISTALTGSGAGLTAVSSGNAQIGNSDVFANATKNPGLVDHQVTTVDFAVVINSKVTGVTNLTAAQIKDIYTGKATNWSQVGGPSLQIVAVSRPSGSGTRVTFEQFVLEGKESVSGPTHLTASTTGDVAKTVSQTAGAISYVATSAVASNNLTAVTIDGVQDTAANVQSNSYKFWNIEHMYTKGPATGLAQAFIDYMQSDTSKKAAKTLGFIDISTLSAAAVAAKQPKS